MSFQLQPKTVQCILPPPAVWLNSLGWMTAVLTKNQLTTIS